MPDPLPNLVVVYGPPFSGTAEAARAIAGAMPGRSAVLSVDALLSAIAISWEDAAAELEMVHQQVRLLAAYYLKHRYNLVVEGPFIFEREGRLVDYQPHIDQLLALMRNLVSGRAIVRIEAGEEAIREAARTAGAGDGGDSSLRVAEAYRPRSGPEVLTFDAASNSAAQIAAVVREQLMKGTIVGGR
jgi:hypothetical protein